MDGPVSSQFRYVTWRIKTYYSTALDICSSRSILNIQDMDDLSRALTEALLKELKCPVCMEYMVPPIKLCTSGHNICSKCRESSVVLHAETSFQRSGMWLWKTFPEDRSAFALTGSMAALTYSKLNTTLFVYTEKIRCPF